MQSVRNDVVAQAGAKGAGIAEKIDLNRRGPQGHDRRPRSLGEPLQINQNVDLIAVNGARRFRICQPFDGSEMVKGLDQSSAHRLPVVETVGIGMGRELRAVMGFQHFDDQERRGVIVEIIGEIAEFDRTALPVSLRKGEGQPFALRSRLHEALAHPYFRTIALLSRADARFGQQQKGRNAAPVGFGQTRPDEAFALLEILPVAHGAGAYERAHGAFPTDSVCRACA